MAPTKGKDSSRQTRDSSRQTRAKYNALPENLPGLKTRSGKQIKSSKTDKKPIQTSTPKVQKEIKNQHDKKKITKVDKKTDESSKKTAKASVTLAEEASGKEDDNVKKVESHSDDNEDVRTKPVADVKEQGKRSSTRTPQSKRTKVGKTEDGQKSPRKPIKSVTISKETADGVAKTASKSKNNDTEKTTKHKLSEKISTQKAKKAKYSEEQILSPRRSSRALVPNRRFKDMEMEWDINSVKKEPVNITEVYVVVEKEMEPVSTQDSDYEVEMKEREREKKVEKSVEKPVEKPVEINSFSPGKTIKVTVPYTGKRKAKPRPKPNKSFTIPVEVTHKEAVTDQQSTSEPEQKPPREMKENYTIMKIQTQERVLESSSDMRKMAVKANSLLKIQPASPSTNLTKPSITIIKAPEKSSAHTTSEALVPSEGELSEEEIYSDDYSDGEEVAKFTEDTLHDTDHSSLLETSNSSPYNSDADDLQDISTDGQAAGVINGQSDAEADNEDEYEVENSTELMTIDLQSDQIHEVRDVTDLVKAAVGSIEARSEDMSDKPINKDTEEISQLLTKLTGAIDEAAQAESTSGVLSTGKSNLPYRVIPIQSIPSKPFGRAVTSEHLGKSSEALLHGTIKPLAANEGRKEIKLLPSSKITIGVSPKTTNNSVYPNAKEILVETKQPKSSTLISKPQELAMPGIVHKKSEDSNKRIQTGSILVLNDKSTVTSQEKALSTQLSSGVQDQEIVVSVIGSKEDDSESFDTSSSNNSSDLLHRSILESIENGSDESESEPESDFISSTSTSISTQTPIIDKKDSTLFLHDKSKSPVVKTKTISVNVQKPGEELQVKDGEVTAEAQKQEFIIVHLPEGTTIKNYKVQSRSKLEDDIAFTQDENGQYFCGECNYSTMKKANWYKHKRRHLGQLVKTHACSYCSYRASTSSNLKRHLSIHADIRMFKCGICQLTFRQKIHLERHIKYRHEVKQVKCPLCDYICANENPDLKVHIKRKHLHPDDNGDSVQAFTCSECGLTTLSRKDLKQHQKFHRKGPELKLFCEHCSFVTDCESRLRRHMFIHTKEKPFECSLCDYRGSQKEHVLRHMRAQHHIEIQRQSRKSYTDTTSNEDSNDGKDMEKNNKADYSSQEKIFACNHCSMKFAKLINLYKHLHSQHKDIMPYEGDSFQCVVCDFTTNNKKNLLVHMRRHNLQDQSPPSHVYSCVLCRYMNPKRRNLFQHMKKKHGIDIVMKDVGSANCFVTENSPVVVGSNDTNVPSVGNIFAGTDNDSPLQIVTDDLGSTSAQNVITIQELAYAVSNPQIINDNNVVIVEQGQEGNNIHLNSLVQHEAAEAIEGLQALAEQPGIFEMQTVIEEPAIVDNNQESVETSIEELQNLVDNSVDTKIEVIDNSGILVGEEDVHNQMIEAGVIEETVMEKDSANDIQLSAEELMHLSSGDYVEINGEMYKVEIRSDDSVRTDDVAVSDMATAIDIVTVDDKSMVVDTAAGVETTAEADMETIVETATIVNVPDSESIEEIVT